MELKQIYEKIEGDYNNVLKRLITEERIKKYLLKFRNVHMDTLILQAIDDKDYETAFRETHNLKGLCANLSLDRLGASASALTDALRGGEPDEDISSLIQAFKEDYEMTINELKNLE